MIYERTVFMNKTINLKRLLINIALPPALGVVSALISGNMAGVYRSLEQPPLSPPPWVFAIAWSILYILMGVAAYAVSDTRGKQASRGRALKSYYIQLAINVFWPVVFFRFKMYTVAVVVLVLLTAAVLITFVKFKKVNNTAALLLIPYIIWIFFALYLNIGTAVLS